MGSVKDLKVLKPAYENKPGVGNFVFSNRYSVFDWGKMPDLIKDKGASLATMAAFNFERLEEADIETHYRGIVSPEGDLIRFDDLKEGSGGAETIQVNLGVVYHPIARRFVDEQGNTEVKYDYSLYDTNRGMLNNYLIPLEIIFRNGLPKGSSVFKRIDRAKKIDDEIERDQALNKIFSNLGVTEEPKPGDMLPKPILGYTTKLEPGDRKLDYNQAVEISGLSNADFNLEEVALNVNDLITKQAKRVGLVHYDGKVEMLYNRDTWSPVVADVVGTLDENRFGLNGEQISKEVKRQWYHKNQPGFSTACDEFKKTGPGWQERSTVKPIKLDSQFAELDSQMYTAACNRYVQKDIFNVPDLDDVMDSIREHR
jgi:phosphoribosylaminoimidazole-succinocarboxamide synthase